jgi:hypothetical protein
MLNDTTLAHEFTYIFAISMVSTAFASFMSDDRSLPTRYMLLEYLCGRYG